MPAASPVLLTTCLSHDASCLVRYSILGKQNPGTDTVDLVT